MRRSALVVIIAAMLAPGASVRAGGGFLGMDHRLSLDNDGVWQRRNQWTLLYGTAASVGGIAVWEGSDDRLGRTSWQGLDALAMGGVAAQALKYTVRRERPSTTDNPDHWFETRHDQSFPSGEVTVIAAMVTPYVIEYGREQPLVYALELLPVLDGVARMKVRGHWQSDVLAGFALGSTAGYVSHRFEQPFFVSVLPRGVAVGLKSKF